jgi:Fic family protein
MYDPRQTDAEYRSFPAFADWTRNHVDLVRWDRYSAVLQERGKVSAEQLAEAREVVKRAAAVDTGAIEGLYEVDRGFTFTVATQAAIWEAAVDARGQKVRALIESQLRAYDYVLDVATQNRPISETWIRTLHQELCTPQQTYTVVTEVGIQTQKLPLGEYKHLPNHVRLPTGGMHAYAPVDLVSDEIYRLCEILRSDEFLDAHPVLQASYAHYAFVVIHPFADGNGRVARALASVYTYRSHSIPLLVLVEHRKEYLDSLLAADTGNHQSFVDFVMERALDSISLVDESLRAAAVPEPRQALEQLTALFTTKGGYTQEEVHQAGQRLLSLMAEEVERQANLLPLTIPGRLKFHVSKYDSDYKVTIPNFRAPQVREGNYIDLSFQTGLPLSQNHHIPVGIAVPNDAGRDDDIYLLDVQTQRRMFSARMSELNPDASAVLRMRLSIAAQRIVGEAITELVAKARQRASESTA